MFSVKTLYKRKYWDFLKIVIIFRDNVFNYRFLLLYVAATTEPI